MNKIVFLVALLALTLSGICYYQYGQNTDQVYVDVNKLIEGYERTKIEQKGFEDKRASMNASVDSLMSVWQSDLKAYEKELASMSNKQLEERKQLLQSKQQQIRNYKESVQKKISEENQKMTQTIINDINDYVKEYGKENGYKIIFGAMGSGNIMYAAEGANITELVLDGLNNRYNGK